MSWVATAIIGSAVLGAGASIIAGNKSANAATQAAQLQADAANRAADLQWQQYLSTKNTLSPFVGVGQAALSNMSSLIPGGLQLRGSSAGGGSPSTVSAPGANFAGQAGQSGASGGSSTSVVNGQQVTTPQVASLGDVDPSKMTPDQIKQMNASLTQQLRDNLSKKYGDNQNLPAGTVGGAYNDPSDPSKGAHFDPNNINVDITQPGWDPKTLQSSYPELNTPQNLAPVNSPAQPDQAPSPFLTNLQNQMGPENKTLTQLNNLVSAGPTQVDKDLFGQTKNLVMAGPVRQDADLMNAAKAFVPGSGVEGSPFLKDLVGFTAGAGAKYGLADNSNLTALNSLLGIGGKDGKIDGSAIQAALESTPGYQFTLDQGLKATQNGYAAKGLGNSGAAMKGAADYATGLSNATYEQRLQDYLNNYNSKFANSLNAYNGAFTNTLNTANSDFTNRFNANNSAIGNSLNTTNTDFTNRFNANNSAIGNTLNSYNSQLTNAMNLYGQQVNTTQNLINTGENAAAQTGTIGANTAGAVSNTLTSGAAAGAAGIVGSANASSNALVGATNAIANGATSAALISNPNVLNSLTGRGPAGAPSTPSSGIYSTGGSSYLPAAGSSFR